MKSWQKKYLSDVADFCLGKMLDQRKNRGESLPYLANINVRWGTFDLDNLRNMRFELHERDRYGLKYGDIVMCEGGEPGRCAIWKDNRPGMMIQKALHRIRPHDCLDNRFLYYSFLHKGNSGGFAQLFTGATIKHLPRQNLAKVEIDLPPLQIQQRIADVLSAYDDLIENNRRRIQLLEKAARLLYKEWFVHLRFPGHEHAKITDGVPEGWEKRTVSVLGKIVTGKTPSTKTPENFRGDIPFVKTPDMHKSRVVVETEEFLSERGANTQANKTLPVGSILVACIGAKLGVVSITCKPCQTNQQINAVIPYHEHYRYYSLFALIDIKPRLEAMGGGATMPNVNKSKFASIPMLIPSQVLLQEFQEFSGYTFQQIQLLHQQNVALIQARDLLLHRLMNGEISV